MPVIEESFLRIFVPGAKEYAKTLGVSFSYENGDILFAGKRVNVASFMESYRRCASRKYLAGLAFPGLYDIGII